MLNDFFNLIFPKICFACNGVLLKHEKVICTSCQFSLPKTNYHLDKENPLTKVLQHSTPLRKKEEYKTYYIN